MLNIFLSNTNGHDKAIRIKETRRRLGKILIYLRYKKTNIRKDRKKKHWKANGELKNIRLVAKNRLRGKISIFIARRWD